MRLTDTTFAFALIVPILVHAGSDFDLECPPNKWVERGCEVNPHLCQIMCDEGSVCTSTGSPCSVGDGNAPMDAAKCDEFCKASWVEVEEQADEDLCRFWRFVSFYFFIGFH